MESRVIAGDRQSIRLNMSSSPGGQKRQGPQEEYAVSAASGTAAGSPAERSRTSPAGSPLPVAHSGDAGAAVGRLKGTFADRDWVSCAYDAEAAVSSVTGRMAQAGLAGDRLRDACLDICDALASRSAPLATILAKKAAHPARRFVTITAALTVLSLIVPAGAGATATATRLALAAAHLLVAGIVIPILARRLRPARRAAI